MPLGLGRAPGTDQVTSHALRRSLRDIDQFPNDVIELINYLGPGQQDAKVKAIPGQGSDVPVWLLGSSTYSAQLAGILGLPFAYASHFAPTHLFEALRLYRTNFKTSRFLAQPHAMACVNVIVAQNNEEAAWLATSFQQLAPGLFRNDRRPLPAPVKSMDEIWTAAEKAGVEQMTKYLFAGNPETMDEISSAHKTKSASIEKQAALFQASCVSRDICCTIHHAGGSPAESAALNDLNTLRAARITGYVPEVGITGAALLQGIADERRRELVGEGHRFFDLKRTKRILTRGSTCGNIALSPTGTCSLVPTAREWALPIPESVRNPNPNLTQNPLYN